MRKLNLVFLAIFLGAMAWVFMMDRDTTRAIQQRVLTIFSPFIDASSAVDSATSTLTKEPLDPAALRTENERLRQEVSRLRIVSQRYEQAREENDRLRRMLDYKESAPLELVPARVIQRTAGNWWSSLVIDKGLADGVGTDSPVLTEAGLVGKTAQVSERRAVVILLTDEQCRVAARIEGTPEQGILMGQRGGFETRPDLVMRFLSKDARLRRGMMVYSSGVGGLFPVGLPLGKVKEFRSLEIYGEALIEPAVDFGSLTDVFVVRTPSAPPPTSVPRAQPVVQAENEGGAP